MKNSLAIAYNVMRKNRGKKMGNEKLNPHHEPAEHEAADLVHETEDFGKKAQEHEDLPHPMEASFETHPEEDDKPAGMEGSIAKHIHSKIGFAHGGMAPKHIAKGALMKRMACGGMYSKGGMVDDEPVDDMGVGDGLSSHNPTDDFLSEEGESSVPKLGYSDGNTKEDTEGMDVYSPYEGEMKSRLISKIMNKLRDRHMGKSK